MADVVLWMLSDGPGGNVGVWNACREVSGVGVSGDEDTSIGDMSMDGDTRHVRVRIRGVEDDLGRKNGSVDLENSNAESVVWIARTDLMACV